MFLEKISMFIPIDNYLIILMINLQDKSKYTFFKKESQFTFLAQISLE